MGEVDIVGNDRSTNKKIKCRKCGFSNSPSESAGPEILYIHGRETRRPSGGSI